MTSRAPLALAATFLASQVAAQPPDTGRLDCTLDHLCGPGPGCVDTSRRFGLRLDTASLSFLTDTGEAAGFALPRLTGGAPEGMQVFAGPDGDGFALLTLRRDGALTLSIHTGRRAGPPANDATLATGRCEGQE